MVLSTIPALMTNVSLAPVVGEMETKFGTKTLSILAKATGSEKVQVKATSGEYTDMLGTSHCTENAETVMLRNNATSRV